MFQIMIFHHIPLTVLIPKKNLTGKIQMGIHHRICFVECHCFFQIILFNFNIQARGTEPNII